jgi:predicted metal-dependent phosphoesterase TrpH
MAFDLHTHSRSSDGLLTPLQLVARAKTVGLAGLALTDHDTVDGIPQFLQAGKKLGLLCLPGVELSTVYQGVECHILGYRIDHRHRGLLARLGQVIRARKTRAEQILALLAQHGLRLSWSELKREAPGDYVGSFHIYRALKAKGLIGEDRTEEAYDYYFGPQGLASVPHSELSSVEAIALIKAAGGVPVLAHPGRTVGSGLIKELVPKGLEGIEVYHPHHPPELIEEYTILARELGLLITGGSDFHGVPGERELGSYYIERMELERLIQN